MNADSIDRRTRKVNQEINMYIYLIRKIGYANYNLLKNTGHRWIKK